jgi:hypothetical protein
VLGAVSGIESKAVIDGTSLSGAMSQDRFAFSSAHQGARRSQGAEIRELAGRVGLRALDRPALADPVWVAAGEGPAAVVTHSSAAPGIYS